MWSPAVATHSGAVRQAYQILHERLELGARPWPAARLARDCGADISNQILELTKAIHAMTAARAPAGPSKSDSA
jgi:hypothetical protein